MSGRQERFIPQQAARLQEKRRKREEQEHDALIADFRRVLATAEGLRVLWFVLSQGFIFRSCFTGNASTYFNEGKRDLGLRILEIVDEADSSAFEAMRREERRRAAEREEREKAEKTGA